MTTPSTNPIPPRPWERYRPKEARLGQGLLRWKLLIPGWGGALDDDELAFILTHLKADEKLRLWWGIPPRWKSIPLEVVKRIALTGSDDDQAHNRRLARPQAGNSESCIEGVYVAL
jgi:hypothetical protein